MKRWIIVVILTVAAILRLYNLSHVPPSPSLDEVSIGYNANSILHTGKDEYGSSYPLLLRAYDDYRPALYVYLTVPFVWILGLTTIAVRLPSIILSMILVYMAYAIGKILGKKYLSSDRLGEITAGILAISPWHIYISRLGHEANLGLTLVTCGVYFFLRAVIAGHKASWIYSAAAFAFSVHGYQSEKIVTPLLILFGTILFWKNIRKAKSSIVVAVIVGGIVVLPAIIATMSPSGLSRLRGTSAFSSDAPAIVSAQNAYSNARKRGDLVGQIIHSRYITYTGVFLRNYASHFSYRWLFTGGDLEAHKVPGMGLLYLWEAPFLLIGLWSLWKSRIPKNVVLFLVACLLVAPVPASITTASPHAMRSYTYIPFIQIIEAIGIWYIFCQLIKKYSRVVYIAFGVIVIYSVSVFWRGYFVRFPNEQSDSFQYAMRSAVAYALQHNGSYERVEMSHQGALYQSYMFFLFYSRFDPVDYQRLGGTISGGYEATHYIGTYAFGFLPERIEDMKPNILYFYDAHLVPAGLRKIATFESLSGVPRIVAAEL